ncbi:MAG: metallophosphoesterase [Bryobacterales bacterium]|nr:metallophosphoesterase [Bryobacterales bacterium]
MGSVIARIIRVLPDLIVMVAALAGQLFSAWWGWRHMARYPDPARRRARSAIAAACGISTAVLLFGVLLRFDRVLRHFPKGDWHAWTRGVIIAWMLVSLSWLLGFAIVRWLAKRSAAPHSATRRHFLRTAHAAAFAAPPAVVGAMFVQRNRIELREHKIEIPGLPPALDGLRLVQLTDIHMGPFLSRRDLKRAVAMANETRAHVALVTGDLITNSGDPLDDCLDALAALRAEAGVFGCLGNHEQYADAQDYSEREGARRGLRFLRQTAAPLRFGNATLNLAGVDYQRLRQPYLVGAEKMIQPEAFNLLLSHNPDVFPVAARQGFPLTISGHTHGGQVRVEILSADLNMARFYTPYVDGLYRQDAASIFVSRGIGTIGIPARFGAPPEVSLLTLKRV